MQCSWMALEHGLAAWKASDIWLYRGLQDSFFAATYAPAMTPIWYFAGNDAMYKSPGQDYL